jgi:GTP diphosphokinase / guanosine-3',5'-bis(diphosphate) 3'-diphosphatase
MDRGAGHPMRMPAQETDRDAAAMMRQYELVERVRRYNPNANEDLLNRAYVFAMKAHGTQKRASGDPYFSHPLEVAAILTELKVDDATIVAAMLHDTIEDTAITREDVDKAFGEEIGGLVDGLTKLGKLDFVTMHAQQAENFRKLLLAIADDARVLLVKLADRLHNMRTLRFVPEEKRARVAQDTLDIYAPLAGRMGMQSMRSELEDLSFRCLMPDAYALIMSRLEALKAKNGAIIARIAAELTDQFVRRGIKVEVKGRQKAPYSIWKKMERRSIAFEQLSDIYGFRIQVDTVADCYAAVGVAHTTWPAVPGRFKDYISTPKQNDYRSIHTTVIGPGSQRVELQIRTHEMHEVAEYGIAAHTIYKDGRADTPGVSESRAYRGLRQTIEALASDDSEKFLEHTKLELFHDQVFCFTPKGRLIALPRGATAIDFAYAVHTDIGNSAVGCKINGHIAPLISVLQNGDEVLISRAERSSPPAAWDGVVVTGRARAAIRRATREAARAQFGGLGRQIVERAFERAGRKFSESKLKAALPRLARTSIDDVFIAVGRGEIYSPDVVRAVHPDFKEERKAGAAVPQNESGWFNLTKVLDLVFRVPGKSDPSSTLPVRGIDMETAVRFAPKGGAVPGERIVGIRGPEGITIYPIHSPALAEFNDEPDRWLDVRWDLENADKALYSTQIVVTMLNEPGALGAIATAIGEQGANIDAVSSSISGADFRELQFDVQVRDIQHLNAILAELRGKSVVHKVERLSG